MVASETEEQIYAALGLAWIPPVLREDAGEIEAAENGTLPRPLGDVIGDFHVHTSVSGDGRSTLEEVVAAALARGCRVLAITEHAEGTLSGVGREALLAQRAEIRALQATLGDSLRAPARRRAEHRPERRARLRRGVPRRLRLVPRVDPRPLRARPRGADPAGRHGHAGSVGAHDRAPLRAHDRRPAARRARPRRRSSPRRRRPAPRSRSTARCRASTSPSTRCAARAACATSPSSSPATPTTRASSTACATPR